MYKCEEINPYSQSESKGAQVRTMFDNIAPAYDFMNRAMTLGIDKLWRRKAVKLVAESHPRRILDVATGTGDLAIALARNCSAGITGIDLSSGMIEIGRHKIAQANLDSRIKLVEGDCLELPFDDNQFDCITVAYGVRNFENIEAGYRSMLRVLKPGGKIIILELSVPQNKFLKALYHIYTRSIIPFVGRLISNDHRAYSYLPESIAAVPQRREMTTLMEKCGFSNTKYKSMTFGVCTMYYANK